jgi:hypothetical protein
MVNIIIIENDLSLIKHKSMAKYQYVITITQFHHILSKFGIKNRLIPIFI